MQYLNEVDGSPLPVDQYGRVVIWPADDSQTAKTLPTGKLKSILNFGTLFIDETGRIVHQILGPDGQLLPRDPSGRYTDYRNEPIPLNDFGKPLDKNGQVSDWHSDSNFLITEYLYPI